MGGAAQHTVATGDLVLRRYLLLQRVSRRTLRDSRIQSRSLGNEAVPHASTPAHAIVPSGVARPDVYVARFPTSPVWRQHQAAGFRRHAIAAVTGSRFRLGLGLPGWRRSL